MTSVFTSVFCSAQKAPAALELRIKNDQVQRVLQFDGKVWRTTRFLSGDGTAVLAVKSEEFFILPMNSDAGLTLSNFTAAEQPKRYSKKDTSFCEIAYRPLSDTAGPHRLLITYFAVKGERFIRKRIRILYDHPATVDRLEVERFINGDAQCGGGRGEPVFIKDQWFTGLEYPAGYARCKDGNTPKSYGRYYDAVGNYSFIDLEGRDIEPRGTEGMVRLMHFPGYAVASGGHYEIQSKTAVTGFAANGMDITRAFMRYLETIWKKPRSFVNYNNWFDASAKDLRGDRFVNVYKKYKAIIEPYGIKIDGMVPDDGWQDRNSIWKPSPKYFPNGDADLAALSRRLKAEGTRLGLWLSINNYTSNIDWGVGNGYAEAKRNKYFSQYGRYYSLSATKYKEEILQRVPELARKADLVYFKHDFNDLCDAGEGNNHPPTERHGHEANLDVALQVLTATRKAKPEIFQNLTNWIWFSPWWLQYADFLWMLAGDDGINGNTPELSRKAMFTTDRDTYIWRMFGNPADRPLVPVSRLMTHGILQTSAEEKDISLQDWADYVVMHYGRGTLLKEWYISLNAMRPELWKALAGVQKWAGQYEKELNNTVFVGGRPDEGNAYGYIGWNGARAILTARNPSAATQTLTIPFNSSTGFYGAPGQSYKARVTYPYDGGYPATFESGKNITIALPGYATMVVVLERGTAPRKKMPDPSSISFRTSVDDARVAETRVTVPSDIKGRCELLVIGYPALPAISIDDRALVPQKTSRAKLNNFAGYAVAGMKSSKATDWNMAGYDLAPWQGKEIRIRYAKTGQQFESFVLVEQRVPAAAAGARNDLPVTGNDVRRQTVQLY
ncbi:alpha-amylase family protein [Niabella drilacis]|uniref:Melibiase n=1 Tax=Niabella drilacis (strain DSM 25811 / CCM 8410 / CCUG 62505 / LMG 26954 / E90) TaxID=1285928 RepID=A0A1G6R4Y1_NIADE|nr:hypothetical protein [Niabella drilacis]SDC99672.1 hypothetical protein SAMN04487894_105148 [Niabella drilacis]